MVVSTRSNRVTLISLDGPATATGRHKVLATIGLRHKLN